MTKLLYISASSLYADPRGQDNWCNKEPLSITKKTSRGSCELVCLLVDQMNCANAALLACLGSPEVSNRDVGILLSSKQKADASTVGVASLLLQPWPTAEIKDLGQLQ